MKITIGVQGTNGGWTERTYEDHRLDPGEALWFSQDFLSKFLAHMVTDMAADGDETREHAIMIRAQR